MKSTYKSSSNPTYKSSSNIILKGQQPSSTDFDLDFVNTRIRDGTITAKDKRYVGSLRDEGSMHVVCV